MDYAYLRGEGKSLHPDDTDAALTNDQYLSQLQAYFDDYGDVIYLSYCSRPKLLDKLV